MITEEHLKSLRNTCGKNDWLWCVCTIALEGPITSYAERFGGAGFQLTTRTKRDLERMTQAEAREQAAAYWEVATSEAAAEEEGR
jgi:hypothetical protein